MATQTSNTVLETLKGKKEEAQRALVECTRSQDSNREKLETLQCRKKEISARAKLVPENRDHQKQYNNEQITRLKEERNRMKNRDEERAQLRGIDVVFDDSRWQKPIGDLEEENRKIDEKSQEFRQFLASYPTLVKKVDTAISEVEKETWELYDSEKRIQKNIKTIDRLIAIEEWRNRYLVYATQHFIEYDEDDEDDLFLQCNLHHLKGTLYDVDCGGDSECEGWRYGDDQCECGNRRYTLGNSECEFREWLSDPSVYNLDDHEPVGYPTPY